MRKTLRVIYLTGTRPAWSKPVVLPGLKITTLVHGVPGDTVRGQNARMRPIGTEGDIQHDRLGRSGHRAGGFAAYFGSLAGPGGAVPARADEFSARPESAPGLGASPVPGATVALVSARADGPARSGLAAAVR